METVPENSLSSRPLAIKIVEILVVLLINVLSLGGNVLVCVTVYSKKNLRTITNMFIIAVCVADILLASVAMPLTLGSLIMDYWPFGDLTCQIQGFCIHLLVFQSLHIITLTAMNRNLNVVRPWLYKRIFTKWKTLFLILTVIILTAVVMGVLVVSLSSRYVFHPGKAICVMTFPNIDASLRFTVAFGILFVVFPAIIISACYARVLQTIRSHRREYDAARGKYDSRSILSRKEMKLSKLVSVIILGFSLCWIPCVIIDIIDTTRKQWFSRQLYMFYTCLAYTSAVLNPWIYGFMNKLVRKEMIFLSTSLCRFAKRRTWIRFTYCFRRLCLNVSIQESVFHILDEHPRDAFTKASISSVYFDPTRKEEVNTEKPFGHLFRVRARWISLYLIVKYIFKGTACWSFKVKIFREIKLKHKRD